MTFTERLKQLPPVSHLAGLEILDDHGRVVATLLNRPGQAGSVAVYHALARLYDGRITPQAATLGLEWYAEHTADAVAHPGQHPNIDRLLAWSQQTGVHTVRPIPA